MKNFKFMWNGIKVDGILHKASYSIAQLNNYDAGTITIYGKRYKPLPNVGWDVRNESDMQTDYFENDRIRVTPIHPLYKDVLEAYNKQEAHYQKVKDKTI